MSPPRLARLGALSTIAAIACSSSKPAPAAPPVQIKAHRGASAEAPENTLAAARLAWRQGAGAVEVDVRLSADRVPVIIHDETTRRTGGRDRPVAAQKLAELRQLDVGRWKHPRFADERIPTLAEMIGEVPAGRTLFVEIKVGRDALDPILSVIAKTPCRGTVAIESSRVAVLEAIRARGNGPPLHWTVHARRDDAGRHLPHPRGLVEVARGRGYAGLAVDARGFEPALATAARRAGLTIGVWTVDDPRAARSLASIGVDFIETNRPAAIAAALKSEPRRRAGEGRR